MHAYLEQWDIQTSIDCFTAESTRWIARQDTSVAELSTHSVAVELSEVLRGSSWKLPPVATNQRHALSGEKSRKGKRKKHPVPAICQSPRRQSARPRKRPKLLTGKEAGPNSDGTTSGLRLREIKGSSYSRNAPTVNVFLRFLYVFECTVQEWVYFCSCVSRMKSWITRILWRYIWLSSLKLVWERPHHSSNVLICTLSPVALSICLHSPGTSQTPQCHMSTRLSCNVIIVLSRFIVFTSLSCICNEAMNKVCVWSCSPL